MNIADFPESNIVFGPPPDLDATQCAPIPAFRGIIQNGSVDGAPVVVTAWKPTPIELERLNQGHPVFVSFLGHGIPGHMLTTEFESAIRPL